MKCTFRHAAASALAAPRCTLVYIVVTFQAEWEGVHTTSHDLLDYTGRGGGRTGPATDGVNIVDHAAPPTLNSRMCGADISPLGHLSPDTRYPRPPQKKATIADHFVSG